MFPPELPLYHCPKCGCTTDRPFIETRLFCPVCHTNIVTGESSQNDSKEVSEAIKALDEKLKKEVEEIYQVVGQRLDELEYRRYRDVDRHFLRLLPQKITVKYYVMFAAVILAVILYLTGITTEQRQKHADKFLTDLGAVILSVFSAVLIAKKDDNE